MNDQLHVPISQGGGSNSGGATGRIPQARVDGRWWLRWFISRCGEIDLLGGRTGVWLAEGRCSSAHNLIKKLQGERGWWRCEHFRANMGGSQAGLIAA